MRSKLTITFAVLAIFFAAQGNLFAQSKRQLPLMPGLAPPAPPVRSDPGNIYGNSPADAMPLRSIGGQSYGGPARHFGRRFDLDHGRVDPNDASVSTIPHWSDSFTYHGLVYKYTMVGTDPKRGSATTVIPTVLIPIRFVFADGNVFDATTDVINGQTPIQGIINSPIFKNYDFNNNQGSYYVGGTANPVKVGNTQFGDAFQRANFWDSVSTRAPNYHVLLSQPTVLPVQTITVPNGLFFYFADPYSGETLPLVDEAFLDNSIEPIFAAANVSSTMLPIIVWGKVEGTQFGAFHGAAGIKGNALQTYIATSYLPGTFDQDVYVLSHEILEWMDDPFGTSFTPGWDIALVGSAARCDSGVLSNALDRLEVADPVEVFLDSDIGLPGTAYTYHVTEGMFIDFYTRSSRSRSYNGQYSFFEIGLPYGLPTAPSAPCTGHVEFTPTYVDFPGAIFTAVNGINKLGTATGSYRDAARKGHGFVFTGSQYSTLDYPGARFTEPYKINDTGIIVGTFTNASGVHGFSYKRGTWTQIDYPAALDTEVYGINSAGEIVGTYDAFQPVTHAFVLRNGEFQRIDTSFGTQANAFAINDLGSITGVGYTDPFNGPFTAFIQSRSGISQFTFPGSIYTQLNSINNSSDLAGVYEEPDGNIWGMVTVDGYPHQVFAGVWGNDDLGHICGYTYDFEARRYRGFIGTLPLQKYSAAQ